MSGAAAGGRLGSLLSTIGGGKSDGSKGLLPSSVTSGDDGAISSAHGGSMAAECGRSGTGRETTACAGSGAGARDDGKKNNKAPKEISQLPRNTRTKPSDNRRHRFKTLTRGLSLRLR